MSWFEDAMIGGAVAENPAVMTASGWTNQAGHWEQKPSEGSSQLANNLAVLSMLANGEPITDLVSGAAKVITHPAQAVKAIKDTGRKLTKTFKRARASKLINKTIKNTEVPLQSAEIPIEEGYLYHTHGKGYPGYIWNGRHVNQEARPGALMIENGRYGSTRQWQFGQHDPELDRIWWDTNGHNSGYKVYAMKESTMPTYKPTDPEFRTMPIYGRFEDTYRTTKRPLVKDVVQFTYDPVYNTYTAYSPFKEITTNKMTLSELFNSK